jgi:hypothetical protein
MNAVADQGRTSADPSTRVLACSLRRLPSVPTLGASVWTGKHPSWVCGIGKVEPMFGTKVRQSPVNSLAGQRSVAAADNDFHPTAFMLHFQHSDTLDLASC